MLKTKTYIIFSHQNHIKNEKKKKTTAKLPKNENIVGQGVTEKELNQKRIKAIENAKKKKK